MQGERVLAEFDAIKIEGDVKQLAKRLKEKADLLKQAAGVFLDVVSFGVAEWTTAALYQVGHTFESFGKALRDAPPPPEAKTDQEKEDAWAADRDVPQSSSRRRRSTRTTTAGRRPSSSASTTSGRPRCATPSGG